jgi:hypothetical protein
MTASELEQLCRVDFGLGCQQVEGMLFQGERPLQSTKEPGLVCTDRDRLDFLWPCCGRLILETLGIEVDPDLERVGPAKMMNSFDPGLPGQQLQSMVGIHLEANNTKSRAR